MTLHNLRIKLVKWIMPDTQTSRPTFMESGVYTTLENPENRAQILLGYVMHGVNSRDVTIIDARERPIRITKAVATPKRQQP